ncbi:MAG: hypothetical protein GYA47_05460 [Desulfovibrio sp.]|nr:hypothetical protein [Desulfovibrio sp.]
MDTTRTLRLTLIAAAAITLAVPREAPCEPAPFPTTIGIRDASQPPSPGKDPKPFVPRPSTPKRSTARKKAPAKPKPQAAVKPAPPAKADQQVQAAPPLPSPEELNRQYTTPKESLSSLFDAAAPLPAAVPSPTRGEHAATAGATPAQGTPVSSPGPKPAQAPAEAPKAP